MVKEIKKEGLLKKLKDKNVVVVNVLSKQSYEKRHIKGSISIPRSELETGRWKELDKKKEIITHCSSYDCSASKYAAEFLEKKGFKVWAYEGGIKEWAEDGLPTKGLMSREEFISYLANG